MNGKSPIDANRNESRDESRNENRDEANNTPDDQPSDEQLVKAFRAGDANAFRCIVMRYQDRVVRIAAVNLFDSQQAEDVAQEVFVRSHKGLKKFAFRSQLFTWLYRMTKNVCHENNRRRPFDALPDELVSKDPGPASQVSTNETLEAVRRMLEKLPPRQREVVLLRNFERYSVRETAQIMKCKEGTVKALLHQAMNALRAAGEPEQMR